MTKTHSMVSLAAIGGLTATIALLTGLPAASGDELADLRANQELLQRRIDQLSQLPPSRVGPAGAGPSVYGTVPVPGAALVGGSFPRSFLIPGTETSLRVGGFVDETFDYYFQGGNPNSSPVSTTVGIGGTLPGVPLNIKAGATVPGFPSAGNLVPVQINHSRGNGVFIQSPRETRLNVETRTPTAWGESRTFIEFDFVGGMSNFVFTDSQNTGNGGLHTVNGLPLRLRYAYGTLGGLLAGQANSNAADPDANAETLDFGGPAGQAGVTRIPQVRYTIAGPWGSAWSMSAEAPETSIVTPAGLINSDAASSSLPAGPGLPGQLGGVCTGVAVTGLACSATTPVLLNNPTKASAPDITFASYWAQPWGHIDFRGVVRPTLSLVDGAFLSRTFVGYGGGISGDVKPGWFGWNKDDFQFQFTTGVALGRYLNDGGNTDIATNFLRTTACRTPTATCTGVMAASNIITHPNTEFGFALGYQHWWLPNLRSNVAYGYARYGISSNVIGPTQSVVSNKQLQNAHFNVIWSPVAFIDTGLEYTWGQRQVVANFKGQYQTLIGKFRVKF